MDKTIRMVFLIQILGNKLEKVDLFSDLVCHSHTHISGTVIFREQNLMLNCLVQMGYLKVNQQTNEIEIATEEHRRSLQKILLVMLNISRTPAREIYEHFK